MRFRHLLITNFQYPAEFAFLEERLKLFNTLTIPSVRNQTYKNFTWIIIVNTITETITLPNDLGMKHKISSNEEFQSFLLKQSSDYLITTRLTNGDIVHPKFIEEIQKKAKSHPGNYLIDQGFLNYDIRNEQVFKGRTDSLSPFVSLVEPLIRGILPKTIHRRSYRKLDNKRKIQKINKNYAIQTIHDYIDLITDNPYEEPITKIGKKVKRKGMFFNKYAKQLK